jgi:hypothetical protein
MNGHSFTDSPVPLVGCSDYCYVLAALGRCVIDSTPIAPGKDYSLTPVLAAEMPKSPFEPKLAGRIDFFFGPIAGALVSVVSLRRSGHPLRSGKILR